MRYITDEKFRAERGNLKYLDELRALATKNRNNPTEAEAIIWKEIKKLEYPFLRQKPVGRFILDFYYSKLLLAVEIDGDSHDGRENYDKGRDFLLKSMGIKTIRFKNEKVLSALNKVIIDLNGFINDRKIELFKVPLSSRPKADPL